MTKTFRRIGQVLMVSCFLFAVNTANAQEVTKTSMSAVLSQNSKMHMAKERFETTHSVQLTQAEFLEKMQPSTTNLAEWNAVLATYTRDEIKTELQAQPAMVGKNMASSGSDYHYIREIVNRISRNL